MPRLFAALDVPDEIRSGLDAWGARELSDPALRPVPAENLHMTVCFLGSVPDERVEEALRVLEAVEARPVPVRLHLAPVAKPRGRPALFAIEAESPAAEAIASEVSGAFAERGLAEPEERPFWPHLTVARVRSEKRSSGSRRRRPQRVERPPGELPAALGGEFGAVRLSLYRSVLRRDGSQYVPLGNVDLSERERNGR